MKRFLAILHARNMEFLRDRSTLGWSVVFPVLLVLGFAFVFSGEPKPMFKVGVLGDAASVSGPAASFFKLKYIQFVPFAEEEKAIDKVEHVRRDMLVDVRGGRRYWINENSPNGAVLERLLGGNASPGF